MLLNMLRRLDLPRAQDLSAKNLYHLVAAYVLISLPMVALFPFWLSLIALLTVGLKVTAIRRRWQLSKWWILPIMVLSVAMVLTNAQAIGLDYFSVALLFMFASLKLLEAREERDAFMLMLVNFLLMLGVLMANDGPLAFIFVVACFFYNIYIQLRIAQPEKLAISWRQNLRTLLKILLISLPFVVGLFFLFPRLEPLWQQPTLSQATTGLSDEMTPNSLSELTQDGGLAFRVKFNDVIPENNQLYWRGPVLSDFDGKTWRRAKDNVGEAAKLTVLDDTVFRYKIYHDGETRQWVLPLDLPGNKPAHTTLTSAYEMTMPESTKPRAFELVSYPNYRTPTLSQQASYNNRLLPVDIFPKTRQLASDIAKQSKTPADFVQRVLAHFRNNEFFYDLAPPVGNANIDTFLFENRIGYCEHYASSFVFMMRSQGLPARVVTGFQGGELNVVSGDMEVRNYNAHAWAEVYITGKGWLRFDPTAAIAPERVNSGSPFGVAGSTDLISLGARWENQSAALQFLSTRLRAMRAFWQNWIIDYDSDKQNSLWRRLGLSKWKDILWIGFVIILMPVVALLVWWYRRRQRRQRGDSISRAMQSFVKTLEKHALIKPDSQPWQAFIDESTTLAGAQPYAQQVIVRYYQLRYSYPHVEKRDIEQLKTAIVNFKKRLAALT